MADHPLEFYRRCEQQWRRRTMRPLAPIEDAETPMPGTIQRLNNFHEKPGSPAGLFRQK
jgi:hypothetical protein